MRIAASLAWTSLSLLGLWIGGARATSDRVEIGALAPSFKPSAARDKQIDWSGHDGKAIVLVFHTANASRSRDSVTQLSEALRKDPELAAKTVVYAVVDELTAGPSVEAAMQGSRVELHVVPSLEHEANEIFGVIVYPTAFVFGSDRVVLDVIKGQGPMFAFRVSSAARLACGLIDAAQYAQLRAGDSLPLEASTNAATRTQSLVRRLSSSGHDAMALDVLRKHIATGAEVRPFQLAQVRVLLRLGRLDEAQAELEALADSSPSGLALAAQLAVARGELARAEELLAPLEQSQPVVRQARARLLAARGQWQDATRELESAVESLLLFQ